MALTGTCDACGFTEPVGARVLALGFLEITGESIWRIDYFDGETSLLCPDCADARQDRASLVAEANRDADETRERLVAGAVERWQAKQVARREKAESEGA